MTEPPFIHDHPEFEELLTIVSDRVGVNVALVEKDYWVTHTLWALEHHRFRVWFKGGTSLSKGYGLIQRFSEDLDVKLEADGLPEVESWTSQGRPATRARQRFFEDLLSRIDVPGTVVEELPEHRDETWRNVVYAVRYPSRFAPRLPLLRDFVQLEVGSARVTPGEERAITSWVHQHLAQEGTASALADNRPRAIHCVRPAVTLLEKIEGISRRYPEHEPADFVRHYEDAARIIGAGVDLDDLARLLAEMRQSRDIRTWPAEDDPAFDPQALPERWKDVEAAWEAIASMFWGERIPLRTCAEEIRKVVTALA